jgi:hypothetical protein
MTTAIAQTQAADEVVQIQELDLETLAMVGGGADGVNML